LGLTLAFTALVTVIGGLIAVFPDINTTAEILVAAIVVVVVVLPAGYYLVSRIRRLIASPEHEEELTGYTFNPEAGVLLKGSIENVALRVGTVQRLVDALSEALDERESRAVLFEAGYGTGKEWAAEFRKTVESVGIARRDVTRQLTRWAEYDASAGMGRLSIAVTPCYPTGMVLLSNSFLSRRSGHVHLNHWFSGYIAGTLEELLGETYEVVLLDTTEESPEGGVALFSVARSAG
jgi:predicted hydrocarbon binding protein